MTDQTALREAKRPRSLLAGPYGHPIHAVTITLPIGAWTASLVFDLLALFTDDPEPFALGATWLVGIGLVGSLVAVLFGLMDYSKLAHGTRVRKMATTHMIANFAAMGVFLVGLGLRLGAGVDQPNMPAFILSLIAMALIGFSGFLGGEMAYHYGVRVADESDQVEGYSGAKQ